jgi:hypothetical protein
MKKITIEKDIINNIVSEYKDGSSIPKLNKKYGINTRKISQLLKENGVEIRGRRKFFYDENFFENINSKLKAYWLGFLFAD